MSASVSRSDDVDSLHEALQWALAEIEGRTVYRATDVASAGQQRENALGCARKALQTRRTQNGEWQSLDAVPLSNLHRLQHDGVPAAKPKLGGSIVQWAADEIVELRRRLSGNREA